MYSFGMKKMVFAVGTTSPQKIGYLQEVLEEFKIKTQLIPVVTESGVSEQPLTSSETKRGSVNRASRAFKQVPSADFSVGIEVGYHKTKKQKYEMFCWVTIIDKDSCKTSAQSHSFLLPNYHQEILHAGKYLGQYLDDFKRIDHPLIQRVDTIIRLRKPFIVGALQNALLMALLKKEF